MAKHIEAWEYGELTFFEVTPKGATEMITKYTSRIGGKEPVHGTNVRQFEVMNFFGTRGWRLTLIDEVTAPAETEKQTKMLAAMSHIEELTGTPGTVGSVTRLAMARRIK